MSYKLHKGTLGEEWGGLYFQGDKVNFPSECLPCVEEYESNLVIQKKCYPCKMFDRRYGPPRQTQTNDPKPWQVGVCEKCGNPYQRRQATQKRCDPCRAADFSTESMKRVCASCGRQFISLAYYTICQRCRSSRNVSKRRYSNTVEYRRMRSIILEKMGGQCARCQKSISDPSDYHLHHILPVCDGGEDVASNMTLVCLRCHKTIHEKLRRGTCQDVHFRTLASALS